MKNILSRFGKISLLLALIYFVVGCDDDKEDVAPGLYVMIIGSLYRKTLVLKNIY